MKQLTNSLERTADAAAQLQSHVGRASGESAMNKQGELVLERFCGVETYPLLRGSWNVFHDEELDMPTFCVQLEAGPGNELHEDTKTLNAEPSWEVNIVSKSLNSSSLYPGAKFVVPRGYDEGQGGYVTNFYYCSHEQTDDNVIEILAVEGSRLLVRLVGKTVDVNFYDGSKPPTTLRIEAWLTHDRNTKRSMS